MKKPPRNNFLAALAGLLLVLDFSYTQGSTDLQDVYAINVLYTNLGFPPLTGWVQSAGDPCGDNWQGVQCVGSNITEITLSNLNLGGQLGYGLQNFTSLIILDLQNNHIGDVIPFQLPPHLQRLLLSGNQFTGSLPYSLSTLTLLSDLLLGSNHLTGSIPDIFQDLTGLINLDFSVNNFSGQLPASLSALTSLSSLHLQNNQLSGTVDTLASLNLTDLNIEKNLFSGQIPPKLLTIPNFKYTGNQFNTSPASPASPASRSTPPPGSPPSSSRPGNVSSSAQDSQHNKSRKYLTNGRIAAIAVAGLLTAIVAVLVIMFFVMRKHEQKSALGKKYRGKGKKKKHEDKLSYQDVENELKNKPWTGPVTPISNAQDERSEEKAITLVPDVNIKPPPIEKYKVPANMSISSPAHKMAFKPPTSRPPIATTAYTVAALQQSTNSFGQENLIGEGSLGRVYRAELPDGKLLAIKKLDCLASMLEKDEDFLELVANISKLRHGNITELVGYCFEHGQRLLVYEYMSNGTLHEMLHLRDELSKKLSWNARVKTALGAARALEYLHEVFQPAVVHRNFTSINILLDDELNPHLSDCGLATLTSSVPDSQVPAHMLGYNAPEFAMSGAYTMKSDVYSFGVVMLELLTGRKPLDSSRPRPEQSLVRWAAPQLHDIDALSKMVDPALKGIYSAKSLSRFADIISLCVQPEPEFRPPMSEVVQALVRLMQRINSGRKRYEAASGSKSLEPPGSSLQE
ncbi:hypothetical protein SUGI_0676780 [Cryptomeria japonica]|uniref:protein STRUBBELIG-RECEPTOR FAMILY 8 n=1 Tax=Cryptomeria japonica TaxID=3369 RepID=UPI002414BC56|nr:protein STRUBBELIG-RECEPTOR FAMILY 8 [Cryptomeria japonica]XP_057834174.2 protein STRUBBELIG-RECEPTOR FAMILY 8 [Cryptomeria japonica]XP_057834175.2 protein STRUBBELIG-RECEPTOR FAMILY 8 [Cryptomeria japonica]XP_057834176.2 protein STRUBBELIG-RECEPTOR FAMILY 8 [Cryptomeria japonica]XP_057834177.2 protein STRUBBELIG-RECEPTOR FAMILY 8 [Cryptomeria japonica]XP_057834178.2 protein STRUBBELIG-RECEPTOR FAMILY 8 [Cryptomeria japonica]XP_057834180.2 protein STRUBBELIG-RECEPTOR FAMILY 8 [Cryptomeria 